MTKYKMQFEGKILAEWSTPWELGYGDRVLVAGLSFYICGYNPIEGIVFLAEIA